MIANRRDAVTLIICNNDNSTHNPLYDEPHYYSRTCNGFPSTGRTFVGHRYVHDENVHRELLNLSFIIPDKYGKTAIVKYNSRKKDSSGRAGG